MTQCRATSKRTGQQCRAQAITGRTVCRHHGGKSPVGPASARFRQGRYSKYLPERLLERYHASSSDQDMLVLREEVALIDARLADVLKRVETGESGKLWSQLREMWGEFEENDDDPSIRAALRRLIQRGQADWATWGEIRALIGDRQKLVESERKRLVEAQQVIAIDQAMALMAQLVQAVKDVGDDRTLRAVMDAYVRITGAPADVANPDGDEGIIDAETRPISDRDGGDARHRP